ncbi:MAG: PA14 domain-containing protein [Actinomycetota bacterium]|nr:DNRLRE domain-containing protein [Actinomycetota bacterium]
MSTGRKRRRGLKAMVAIGLALTLVVQAGSAAGAQPTMGTAPRYGTALSALGRAAGAVGSPILATLRGAGSWAASVLRATPPEPEPTPVSKGEVPEKRTATSRTVHNADGSFTVEAFPYRVNYKDEAGDWQPIETDLVSSSLPGYRWQNKSNSFGLYVKDSSADDHVTLKLGDAAYTFTPKDFSSSAGAADGSNAHFAGVAASTDDDITSTETGFKETLTLRGRSAPSSYTFLVKGPIASIAKAKNGSLTAKNAAGDTVLVFPAPWAREASTDHTSEVLTPATRHAELSAEQVVGGWEITVSLDKEWLNVPGRRFPVIVDPTTTIQTTILDGYWPFDTVNGGNYSLTANDVVNYIGTDVNTKGRTAIKFNVENTIPFGSVINTATLSMYRDVLGCMGSNNALCSGKGQTINAYRMSQSWGSGDTWNTAATKYDSSKVWGAFSRVASDPWFSVWNDWTVTGLVQGWVSQSFPNYGLILVQSNEAYSQGGGAWESSRYTSDTSKRPKLVINYTANATHGYPLAGPPDATAVQTLDTSITQALSIAPKRSIFRANDGSGVLAITGGGCRKTSAAPPYQTWGTATALPTCIADAVMRTDNDTLYSLERGDVGSLTPHAVRKWTHSGSTWTVGSPVSVDNAALGTDRSIVRTPAGKLWVAISKPAPVNNLIYVRRSDDDGATWPSGNEYQLPVEGVAQLVSSTAATGIIVNRNGILSWVKANSDTSWSSQTDFTGDFGSSTLNFQAVADDTGTIHLVYSGSGIGLRYRSFSGGVWTPALSSPGTSLGTATGEVTMTTDGAGLTLLSVNGTGVDKRTWDSATGWSGASTVALDSGAPGTMVRVAIPPRVQPDSIIPVTWEEDNGSSTFTAYFDYLDTGLPYGPMTFPSDGLILTGTHTLTAAPIEDGGVQRVDFMLDRGNGILSHLGSDLTAPFTYSWNTQEVDDCASHNPCSTPAVRMWPDGAYRVYARAWDNKGNGGETESPLVFVQKKDLGVRSYRPNMGVPIAPGVSGNVNLWNGNLTVQHAIASDSTVLGPLTIVDTYNSQNTALGTAGLGWELNIATNAPFSFSRLIDHTADPLYPGGWVELRETSGAPHWYHQSKGSSYAPYAADFSSLVKNSDGTWTLTLVDGSEYSFRAASGSPATAQPESFKPASLGAGQQGFQYSYDASGRLSSVADPKGRGFTFSYLLSPDVNAGRLHTIVSNQTAARTWTITYDGSGRLTDIDDPVNTATTHYTYDASNRMATGKSPALVQTSFGYDASSRITSVTGVHSAGADNSVTTVSYVSSTVTTVTRPKGNLVTCDATCKTKYTTTYTTETTGSGRLSTVAITLPDGTSKTKTLTWANQNLLASANDFRGDAASLFTYDQAGNLLSERDPIGNTITHAYDENYSGLAAVYYNNTTLTPPASVRRLDPQVNFTAGSGGYPPTGVGGSGGSAFSARWTGYVNVSSTLNPYKFTTTSDDGSRVYVDGRLMVDNWGNHASVSKTSAAMTLTSGLHAIVVEYYNNTTPGSMALKWSYKNQATTPIPSTSLKPGFHLLTTTTDALLNTATFTYEDELPANYTNDDDAFFGRLAEHDVTNVAAVTGTSTTMRTRYTYNSYGQIKTIAMPNGNGATSTDGTHTTTYTYYGESGQPTSGTDCNAASIPQTGLIEKIDSPQASVDTIVVHDAAGNIVKATDGKGDACLSYDALRRPLSMKASDRAIADATTYSYNADGMLTGVSDPVIVAAGGAASVYTYDDLDRLSTATDETGPTGVGGAGAATYTYDQDSNVTKVVNKATGATGITYTPDELDRTKNLVDHTGKTYNFSYDADGRLTQQTYPTSPVATNANLTYGDAAGRLTSYANQTVTGGDLGTDTYTYSIRGERTSDTSPQGKWLYSYDTTGRLEQVRDPVSQRTRRYVFDADSNRLDKRNNAGWTKSTQANSWGADPVLPGNMSLAANAIPQWVGDNASYSRPLKFAFPFGGTTYASGTNLNVSTNGYLTIGSSGGSAQAPDPASTALNVIDVYGKDLQIPDPAAPANLGKGYGVFLEEPADNSFVRIRWRGTSQDGTQAANFEVVLYPSGNITTKYNTLPSTGTARVGVSAGDKLNFLTASGYDGTVIASNAQDVTLTRQADASVVAATYNAADQLISATGMSGITYSTDGEMTAYTGPSPRGALGITYDGRHLATQTTTAGTATAFTIDGEGKTVKSVRGAATTKYRYGGGMWLEDASGTVTTTYVSGPGGLLAVYSGATPSYTLRNGHGDVIKTLSSSGATQETYSYDEFGTLTSAQTPTKYGYTGSFGSEREPDSALVRMGVRLYDPLLGRFTSVDPLMGGSANAYDYVSQNPITGMDLSGTREEEYDGGGGGSGTPDRTVSPDDDSFGPSGYSPTITSVSPDRARPKPKPTKKPGAWHAVGEGFRRFVVGTVGVVGGVAIFAGGVACAGILLPEEPFSAITKCGTVIVLGADLAIASAAIYVCGTDPSPDREHCR